MNSRNLLAGPKTQTVAVLFTLMLVVGLAHYLHVREFGLYEDDYNFISQPMAWSLTDALNRIEHSFTVWPIGRPLGSVLPRLLAFAGWRMAGLNGIYGTGFGFLSLNACLFYLFLKKTGPEMLAVPGAIAFVLFPADTTKPFLTHNLQLQPSLTFFLIAALFYSSGRVSLRRISYSVATLCLITYELTFLPFLALPLLEFRLERHWARDAGKHIVTCGAIALIYGLIRIWLSDVRVQGAGDNLPLNIGYSLQGMIFGPLTALYSYPYRFVTVFKYLNPEVLVVIAVLFVLFIFIFSQLPEVPPASTASSFSISSRYFVLTLPAQTMRWIISNKIKVLVAAVAMLAIAYSLSFFYFPPTLLTGRLTSVHLAASIGSSIVVGWACNLAVSLTARLRLEWLTLLGISFFLAFLAGFGLRVQSDFIQAWRNQQQFWTELVPLVKDAGEDTLIFVEDSDLPNTSYILTHSWADPIILEQLFQYPPEWLSPPRVFIVRPDWEDELEWRDNQLMWWKPAGQWPAGKVALPEGNLIVINVVNGKLVRQEAAVMIQGQPFQLKPLPSATTSGLNKLPLYELLILN